MSPHAQTAISALALIDDREELETIFAAFKDADARIRRDAVRSYSRGDTVEFDLKGGKIATATVEKINRKTVGVAVTHIDGREVEAWEGGSYRVSPSLLRAVESV